MQSLADKFMHLFTGLDRVHGRYTITRKNQSKNKVEGRALTVREPVTLDLWEKHLDGKQGIGIIPIMDNNNVWWGALDIDAYDMDLIALEKQCKDMDLPFFLCKTKSGGAHLYVFFSEMVPASLARSKLAEFSIALGHSGVEIFPKQATLASKRDVGNWINMPYFNAKDTERYCIHFGKKISAEKFAELALAHRISEEDLRMTIPFVGGDFADGPPCLQTLAQQGFQEGSRNKALFNIGVYARLKDPETWETQVEEYNHKFFKPPLPSREVIALCKSVGKKDYGYTCKQDPIVGVCNAEICKSRPFGIQGGDSDISLVLGSLVKVTSIPPTWIIDVEGYRLELRTEDLLNQDAFRRICVEKINKFPPRVKPYIWEDMIRAKLEDVEEQYAPPDATPEGRLEVMLKNFLNGYDTALVRDGLLAGAPWFNRDDGIIYFRSPDLIRYLDNQHFRDMTTREIYAYFRRKEVVHEQFHIKGQNVQCWGIQHDLLNFEPLDVPDVDTGENF